MHEYTNAPHVPSSGMRLWDRVQAAIRIGVVGFFRQSDATQAKRHIGSQKVQEAQLANVRPFGVSASEVDVLLAYGESGREDVVRKKFGELLRRVRAGSVGLILLARHDRLGRNAKDSEELFEAMRMNGVLIMVDGRIYDPSDASDDFILSIYAKFAEYENRARSRWMTLARFAKARERMLPIRLPTPLTWADPEDPHYLAKLEAEGMSHWLAGIEHDRTNVTVDGRRVRVLPFPDARVERCVRLMVDWLLETGSLTKVAARILSGYGAWPVPGQLPVVVGPRYWSPGVEISWSPVFPAKVYWQLRSPALYGTYRYSAPSIHPDHRRLTALRRAGRRQNPAEKPAASLQETFQVRFEEAFKSFFEPAMEERIRVKLRGGSRRRSGNFQGKPMSEPSAILRVVRCAHVREDGSRCGRSIRPGRTTQGNWNYRALSCDRWMRPPHRVVVPPVLGEHVLDVLREVFSTESLRSVVQRVRIDARTLESRALLLERQLTDARGKEEGAALLAIEAASRLQRARGDANLPEVRIQERLVARWERAAAEAGESMRRIQVSLDEIRMEEADFLTASKADLERIVALGTDLPALIERARSIPYGLPRIVEALTRQVWVREIGKGVAEFAVEFPSGAEVKRVFATLQPRGAQPQRLFARMGLAQGISAAEIARRIAALSRARAIGWKPAWVEAAAAYNEHFESSVGRDGEHRTIAQIAAATAQPEEQVRAAAMQGKLGPARWEQDLVFHPTDCELHKAFTDYARDQVASLHGLTPGELVLARDLLPGTQGSTRNKRLALLRSHSYQDASKRWWFRKAELLGHGLAPAGDAEMAMLEAESVRQAVEDLGDPNLRPKDFAKAATLSSELGLRFPAISYSRIHMAANQGRIASVRAFGISTSARRCRDDMLYVHMPFKIRTAVDAAEVLAWLAGKRTR